MGADWGAGGDASKKNPHRLSGGGLSLSDHKENRINLAIVAFHIATAAFDVGPIIPVVAQDPAD